METLPDQEPIPISVLDYLKKKFAVIPASDIALHPNTVTSHAISFVKPRKVMKHNAIPGSTLITHGVRVM